MNIFRSKLFLILFITFIFSNVFSQKNKIDSLLISLEKTYQDSTKCNIYIEIGNLLRFDNFDTALYYYNKSLDISYSKNLKLYQAKSLRMISVLHYYHYNYEKSIEFFLKTIKVYEEINDVNGIIRCYNNLGLIKTEQSQFNEALDYFNNALIYAIATKNKNEISISYQNIGNHYYNLGKYDKAIEFYFNSLKICEEIGNLKGISYCNSNIGVIYNLQKNFNKALDFFNKSLKIDEEINDLKGIAMNYNEIGIIYFEKKKYDTALIYLNKSLKYKEKINDQKGIASTLINIGSIFNEKKKFKEAIDYYLKSLKITEKFKINEKILIANYSIAKSYLKMADSLVLNNLERNKYLHYAIEYALKSLQQKELLKSYFHQNEVSYVLYKANEKLNNHKLALFYANIFLNSKDSIFNVEKIQELNNVEMKFITEKKELEIEKLNKEKQLQQSEILRQQEVTEKQRLTIIFIIIGAILIATFAFFVVNRLKITKKQKQTIEEQKIIVEQKNQILNEHLEEIRSQRDEIESQRDLVIKQKDFIDHQKTAITQSINYAQKIQQAVIPSKESIANIVKENFILFKPKDIVSGDFYWATEVNEFKLFAVADCTGHGVPGAFMSMLGVSFLNEIVRKKEIFKANEILNNLRLLIIEALQQKGVNKEQKDGMDIVLCILNTTNLKLQFSGAFNPLYIVNTNRELHTIVADKQPIAFFEHMTPFTNHEISLNNGDIIYLASDGYKDQYGGENDKRFTSQKFTELLQQNAHKSMQEQLSILENTFETWKGNQEQIDDVTVFGIKV